MKINRSNKGCHKLNEDNVVVSSTWSEEVFNEGSAHHGVGDSLGRTSMAALIYKDDVWDLVDGVMSYFSKERTSPEAGDQWYVRRYPKGEGYAVRGNSRDHVIYALTCLKELGYDNFIKDYIKYKAKRPCMDHGFSIMHKLWFKALYSNFYSFLYLVLSKLYLWPVLGLKTLLRGCNLKSEWVYPTYALFYELWGLQAIKSKFVKRSLRKLYKRLFEESNHVAQLLCGVKVDHRTYLDYKPSRSNRWTTRLDETNRDMTIYAGDTIEDNMELGLLWYVYNNHQKYKE